MKKSLLLCVCLFCLSLIFTATAESIYQVALLQSLAQGYFDGSITVADLKEHGDTGIGTFDGLNGEMIVLEGVVYQATGDGSVVVPADDETVPFSNVTFFEEDLSLPLSDIPDMATLQTTLNEFVEDHGANLFYMVKIPGTFSFIKARSEFKQEKPYRNLDVALAADQNEFDFENARGTMVGLYCPDYMDGLNTPGWHLHFISEDGKKGGHVLNLAAKDCLLEMDVISEFAMIVPNRQSFNEKNLSINMKEAIQEVEGK